MAPTSGSRGNSSAAGAERVRSTAAALSADNQSFVAEIRKALSIIKGVAVDLEKDEEHEKVKQLDGAVLELLALNDESTYLSSVIKSVGDEYELREQVTDFSKALEEKIKNLKATMPSNPQINPIYRQFKEAIWNVHHAGEPMPGEEQEDIVVTNTQSNLLNTTCPMTGKPVIQLESPVRSMDCKHVYEKDPIMHYIRTKKPQPQCPVAGCPRILQAKRVVCDPLLPIEIDEIRSRGNDTVHATMVEDFTELDAD